MEGIKLKSVVPKENLGFLIYSSKKYCYFRSDFRGVEVIQKVLDNLESNNYIYEGISLEDKSELIEIKMIETFDLLIIQNW